MEGCGACQNKENEGEESEENLQNCTCRRRNEFRNIKGSKAIKIRWKKQRSTKPHLSVLRGTKTSVQIPAVRAPKIVREGRAEA